MADRKPSIKFITPRGPLVYPKLNKPDLKFNSAGEYRAKVLVDPADIPDELRAKLEKLRDDLVDETKAKLKKDKQLAKIKDMKVLDVFKDETDKETGEATGKVVISSKMVASGVSKKDGKPWTRAPKLFGADAKKPLSPGKLIWGGTEAKIAVEAMAYYMPKDNEVGVAFYLEAVQVLKLVSGSDKDGAGYGFGQEEGYTEEDAPASPFDNESGEEGASENPAPSGAGDDF